VIAGDGPLAPRVKDAAVRGTIEYVGQLEPGEVNKLLRRARFTIAPSHCYEVQPFSVLESLAAGRPVIASRLGGLAEIVEEGRTGLLVPPHDSGALATAMRILWQDTAYASELGTNAWQYARQHFSLLDQARQLVELYEQLVSGAP
jgi:glycosyltransferase involved in cell wall biosynthesis